MDLRRGLFNIYILHIVKTVRLNKKRCSMPCSTALLLSKSKISACEYTNVVTIAKGPIKIMLSVFLKYSIMGLNSRVGACTREHYLVPRCGCLGMISYFAGTFSVFG